MREIEAIREAKELVKLGNLGYRHADIDIRVIDSRVYILDHDNNVHFYIKDNYLSWPNHAPRPELVEMFILSADQFMQMVRMARDWNPVSSNDTGDT